MLAVEEALIKILVVQIQEINQIRKVKNLHLINVFGICQLHPS